MKTIITSLLITLFAWPLMASDNDTIPVKDIQVTFIYPLGSSGDNSTNYAYKTSLNLVYGATGANAGFEASGFVNTNKYYTQGGQFAGFVNVSGLAKTDHQSTGIQGAGFVNITNNAFKGAQIAGFFNAANRSLLGLQAAGFFNYTNLSNNSVQLAGFGNTAHKGVTSAQVAGFVNHSPEVKGAQVAGFTNIAQRGDTVTQVAGFANIAAQGSTDAQVAGFMNKAQHVKGVQIAGFLNVCDSIDGVPIGFVNIVRHNGYRSFELATTDFAYVQASFKMGVRHFYNIYSFSKLQDYSTRYAFGFGFGYTDKLTDQMGIKVELTAHQELWVGDDRAPHGVHIERLNMVNQLKVGVDFPLSNAIRLNVAPTINVGVVDMMHNPMGNDIGPYWNNYITTSVSGKTRINTWVGFSAGIAFGGN